MRRLALTLTLLSPLAACGDDSSPPPTSAPEPPKKKPPKVSDDQFELTIDDNGGKRTVRVGDRIKITLKAKPAEDSKTDFGWADPEVTGDAMRFVNSTNTQTPDRGDGGHVVSVYEFRANDSGRSSVVIPLQGASEGVPVTKFSYQFLVVWPD